MASEFTHQIFTGPLDVDWLVSELYYGEEHVGDLVEWGEKLILYPKADGGVWQFPLDEFIKAVTIAKERVSLRPKDQENLDQ